MIVRSIKIRKIFATNSLPTIEIELQTKDGTVKSAVPFGTSAGKHEVANLPVDEAIRKFAIIGRHFRTQSFDNQEDVDKTLRIIDKTPNFSEIGGNLALGISAAFLKAFAMAAGTDLFEHVYNSTKSSVGQATKQATGQKRPIMPSPLANVVGGWHGQSDIQEFLLLPFRQRSFVDSAALLSEAYQSMKEELKKEDNSFNGGKNLESAWMTNLNHEGVLKILTRVANEKLLKVGLDVAASNIWDGRKYVYKHDKLIRTEQLDFITDLAKRFPIVYIEDPFEEDDFVSHATLTHRLSERSGHDVMICGDDLYVTNIKRLKIGVEQKSTNTALVKPNQIGTITDTIKFVEEAKKHGMKTVMSHRSGETEDTLICHLAVGLACDYVKFGISGERATKINEMIRIEEKLKGSGLEIGRGLQI